MSQLTHHLTIPDIIQSVIQSFIQSVVQAYTNRWQSIEVENNIVQKGQPTFNEENSNGAEDDGIMHHALHTGSLQPMDHNTLPMIATIRLRPQKTLDRPYTYA